MDTFLDGDLRAMRQDINNGVHGQNRICERLDPREVGEQADGLSVLDHLRAIRDGKLPPPPIARLIGFQYIAAEPGEIVIELQPEHALENSAGILHPGVAAAMLDIVMSAAASTLLSVDKGAVTTDLEISYLKPLTMESEPIRALGRVVDLAEQTAYVTGQIHDGAGSLVVQAVGVVSAINSKQTLSDGPRAASNKPGMWTTIWRTLEAMAY